ncbi:hypothetical protein Q7C36_001844 [Tachysurus vachellii]|uniref:Uncharacterized protein n=1 Tax=Tachysurus vachellii TaxID=175792 RepID=A0AA88T6T4_TACVA|nr:hypothetical protein Q7C36_001844 [Tachysurus vachellii]
MSYNTFVLLRFEELSFTNTPSLSHPNILTGSTFGFLCCSTSHFFSSCILLFHKRFLKSGQDERTQDCGSSAEEMTVKLSDGCVLWLQLWLQLISC